MTATVERERPESCLSDLILDRLILGELAAEGAIAEHLAGCATCRAQLADLRAHQAAFEAEAVPPSPRRQRRWPRRPLVVSIATALASAAAVVVVLHRPSPTPVRMKGGFTLELVARRADGSIDTVLPGGTLAGGDAIRFRVSAPASGRLVIVGLDSAGHVTPYTPSTGSAQPWPAGAGVLVDGSIVLDDTPGTERIVALLCDRAVDVGDAVAAGTRALAVAGGDPRAVSRDLGLGCAAATTWFAKSPR